MDYPGIEKIFFDDGYRLAGDCFKDGINRESLENAIRNLYDSVDLLLEAFLNRAASENNASDCKKGCDWCCYQAVFAVTHEMVLVREYVRSALSESIQHRIAAAAESKSQRSLGKSEQELQKLKYPCPFLQNHICQVYPVRPMACRIYLSSSEQSCREEFEDPADETKIPKLYDFPLRAGRMLNEGFVTYLKEKNFQENELALEQGYMSILTLDQDIDSWIQS